MLYVWNILNYLNSFLIEVLYFLLCEWLKYCENLNTTCSLFKKDLHEHKWLGRRKTKLGLFCQRVHPDQCWCWRSLTFLKKQQRREKMPQPQLSETCCGYCQEIDENEIVEEKGCRREK